MGLEQKRKDYPRFFLWSQIWAKAVLMGSFLPLRVVRKAKDLPKQCIIVSNHTSMLDIPYNLLLFPHPFLFIGKVELSRLPLFGHFYKRTNILIDRSSLKSIRETMRVADEKLQEGYSLCIYPEGGVPSHEVFLGTFKEGAFRLAKEHGLPLVAHHFCRQQKGLSLCLESGRTQTAEGHCPSTGSNRGKEYCGTEDDPPHYI